ncbi:MAG: NUDIX hydrolase [Cytophagales bacterium]|nr:NUDIX hydrolase [Armatimonadota bacterium]
MDQTETVTHSERIFEGRIVKLRVDTVTLPNGKQSKREVIEHSGAVAVVALLDDQTVLLVRQFRLPAEKALLEIVAGGIDAGESPIEAARRELAEEIGMVPDTLIPLYEAFVAPGYTTEKIYGFLARGLRDAPEDADEDEFVEVVSMRLDDAIKAISTGEIEDMKTVAGLTLTARLLQDSSGTAR